MTTLHQTAEARDAEARDEARWHYDESMSRLDVAEEPWRRHMAATLVNLVDTCREKRLYAEAAVDEFLGLVTRTQITSSLRPPLL